MRYSHGVINFNFMLIDALILLVYIITHVSLQWLWISLITIHYRFIQIGPWHYSDLMIEVSWLTRGVLEVKSGLLGMKWKNFQVYSGYHMQLKLLLKALVSPDLPNFDVWLKFGIEVSLKQLYFSPYPSNLRSLM